MLISHGNNSSIIFSQRPTVVIPSLLFTNSTHDTTFPEILILEVIQAPEVDPTLRYRGGYVTTLRTGEGWVDVEDVEVGEVVRCWLKTRHYLVPSRVFGKMRLESKYVGKSGSTNRGYYHTNIKGSLTKNDIANREFHIAVSPGAHGWPHRFHAIGIVPWYAIQRIEVVRRRVDSRTGIDNPRFPLILPIRFPGWLQ